MVDIGANIGAASRYWAGRDRAKPLVSVLVRTHRDAHLLQRSLPVLLRHAPDVELVIVNNDPLQDVRNAIGESADDSRKSPSSRWGSEAGVPTRTSTEGIRESSGGLVMFCNADSFPLRRLISPEITLLRRASACRSGNGEAPPV